MKKKSPNKFFNRNIIKNMLASKQGGDIMNILKGGQGLKREEDTSRPWWLRTENPYDYYSGSRSSLAGKNMTPERASKARQVWDNILNYRASRENNNLNEGNTPGTSAMTKKSGFTMKRGSKPNFKDLGS